MKAEDIRKILIVGAGTMGQQISVPCLMSGVDVSLYDIKDEMLEKARRRISRLLDGFVQAGRIGAEDAAKAMERLSVGTGLEQAARDADMVSENVPEDPKLKGEIFSKLNALCPERTIFTTNTSTLLPSMFAAATGRPDRFAAFHFHDIRVTEIVDVMPHPGTSAETMEAVRDFAVRIGQKPIVMRIESPGYVFNAMLSALFKSAQTLAARGVASVEDIDRAWMGVTRMIIGPFGLMDSVGLDTVWKITEYWAKAIKDRQGMDNAEFMKGYVDRGETGQKAGKGFYSYPNPAFLDPGFLDGGKK